MRSNQFATTVTTLARRISELLVASVMIVDRSGSVVATGQPAGRGGASPGPDLPGHEYDYAQVAVEVDGEPLQVLVDTPQHTMAASPKVAASLIQMMAGRQALPDRDDHDRDMRLLLLRILHGPAAGIKSESRYRAVDLALPRVAVLVCTPAPRTMWHRAKRHGTDPFEDREARHKINAIKRLFPEQDTVIAGYLGEGEIAALVPVRVVDLAPWSAHGALRYDLNAPHVVQALYAMGDILAGTDHADGKRAAATVSIGRYHSGLVGLSRSYADARLANVLARSMSVPDKVVSLQGIGFRAFASSLDTYSKIELAHQLLAPLESYPELIETLQAYFRLDGHQSEVAHALSIHRNTLSYRLGKVAEYTGIDPRCFDDAVQLRMALHFSQPRQHEAEAPILQASKTRTGHS